MYCHNTFVPWKNHGAQRVEVQIHYRIYRFVYLKSVLINAETLQKLVDNKTIFKQPYLAASSKFPVRTESLGKSNLIWKILI